MHTLLVLNTNILLVFNACHLFVNDGLHFCILQVFVISHVLLNPVLESQVRLMIGLFHFVEVLTDVLVLLSHFFV